MHTSDLLQIVIIPVALSILAIAWPGLQMASRRRSFKRLIFRELDELAPYPKAIDGRPWWEHQQKKFVHPKLFADVTENRDFILSLEPELVYLVTQLWAAKDAGDATQWLHYLGKLSEMTRRKKLTEAYSLWQDLLLAVNSNAPSDP